MNKSIAILVFLVVTSVVGVAILQPSAVSAKSSDSNRAGKSQFNLRSLCGSFATAGRADGFQSRSVGVTEFDGRGNVTRTVRINTNDGDGGRRIFDITALGTYVVESDGTCVMYLTNLLPSGNTTEVTYDMVIGKTSRGGGKGVLIADEITAVQREAGVTASLVEEVQTRRVGVR